MRRNNIIQKALIFTLIGATVVGNITPAYAYSNSTGSVDETQSVSENESAECEVYAELGTYFKVIIPKKITLDGASKTGAYTVDVEGDIGGTDVIKVVPEEAFTLTSDRLADVTASVSQDKTQWSYDEILPDSKTIGKGSINASGITAGSWNGSFWFNINLEEGTGSGEETQSKLTLSEDSVAMGTSDSVQVNAYLDGVLANDSVTWNSDNENITVDNGLVETKAAAQVGDTATITVTASNTEELTTAQNILSDLGIITYANADDTLSASFSVTVIDMAYTATGEDTTITSLDIKAGESKDVEVTIIPNSVTGIVSWSTTAPAGLNMVINGNTVTLKAASDMTAGNTYDLVATYGTFSKLLKVNIVSDAHTHSYSETITTPATCTVEGLKTYICNCGYSYTEIIPALGHNYVDGTCTECGDVKTQEGGLYDANGVMLCSWEDSGIDVETDYSNPKTSVTSPYYVLTNKYPTVTKVVVPDSVTNIGNWAFGYCMNLTDVIIPDSVTSIGNYAFNYCKGLTSVKIPDNVTNIGNGAFHFCKSLTNVTISDNVTSIGDSAFESCTNLTSINIDENNANYCSIDGVLFDKNKSTLIQYPAGKSTTYTIPDSVTNIKNRAFYDCINLTNVTIPSSVTSIGTYAFYNCTNLSSVTIANGVTSIGYSAFESCTSLTSMTIPNSVTSIEGSLFKDCTSLVSITLPESVTSIEGFAFYGCTSLVSITLPENVTNIGKSAFAGCRSLTNITIPSGVTSIEIYAFSNCSLTSATFKNPSGWYVGASADTKTTAISSSYLANKSTAATYLKSTYTAKYWTR